MMEKPGVVGIVMCQGHWEYVIGFPLDTSSMVLIVSGYPWEEGTLSLLKTIHAEKIKIRA